MASGAASGAGRICVVTSSFPTDRNDSRAAAGLFARDFCLALTESGREVAVVTPDKIPGKKENLPGTDVHWFPWRGGDKPLAQLRLYRPADALAMISLFRGGSRCLERLAQAGRIDHVMAMWAVPSGYLALGLKRRYGIPFTTWCLGSDIWHYGRYPLLRNVVKKVLQESALLRADGLGLAAEVTRLAGRPCSFMASSRRLDRTLSRPLQLAPGPRFLFVGRYASVKGVDVLLDAMSRFVASGRGGHLYLFGGGPLEGAVRERASKKDLRDRVTVGGFADEETVVSYLGACDCLVIPSRMESIPVVLSDALQMGTPVIASDVGDMGALLRETPAGLVVPAGEAARLAEAMDEFAAGDRERFRSMTGALARRFDVQATVTRWLDDVEGLQADFGRSPGTKKGNVRQL